MQVDFNLIKQIVGNIQTTISNTGLNVVNSLKAHTFKTRVSNFPKTQAIKGTVTVANQRNVEKEVKSGNKLLKSILAGIKGIKFPKMIGINNFPKYPDQKDFPKEFKISNFPKQPPFPKNIRVSNQSTKELKEIYKCVETVNESVKKLKLSPTIKVEAPKPEKIIIPAPNVSVTQEKLDLKALAKLMPKQEKIDYKKIGEAVAKSMAEATISVGGGGGSRKEGQDDLTREYNVSDKDAVNLIRYYGFIGRSGHWYILKENTSTEEYRYIKGSSDYESNWTGRADLEYDYYHEVF